MPSTLDTVPVRNPLVRPASPYKSRDGLRRIGAAMRYSANGLRAAVRHEAAFRQELTVGLPLGRAKDLGSAAVMLSIALAAVTWIVILSR